MINKCGITGKVNQKQAKLNLSLHQLKQIYIKYVNVEQE